MNKRRNIVDSFVSFFSATAGAKRARARAMESMYSRGYEGASRGRRTDGWIAFGSDANAEVQAGGQTLRERARDLVRNNPFAARAVQGIVANTIGYGIQGSPKIGGGDNLKVTELWQGWAESQHCDFSRRSDFYGLQAQIARALVQDGECIIRKIIRTPTEQNPIPLELMVLEADYLDTGKNGISAQARGNPNIIQGIEFDENGRRIAYYLFDRHPGNTQGGSAESKRVPASEIIHCFRADRPGQERGASWFAPVMITMHDLDRFMDASLHKQMVAAAYSVFITDVTDPENPPAGTTADSANSPLPEKLEPGLIEFLPPGKDIKFPNNPSANDFDPFVRANLRSVATGMGITYEVLTGDLSAVNFSSGRMGWLEFHRNIETWRWHMFIPQVCEGVARWFAEACALMEADLKADQFSWDWTPPRREQIDPVTETKAAILQIRSGLKSYQNVVKEQGDDPAKTLEEIAEHNKKVDQFELVLDSDPRKTMQSGVLQALPEETKEPAEDPADKPDEETEK